MQCFQCGQENPILGRVGRRETCFKCGADLHTCKNCEFYDSHVYNECREPSADVVLEKDRANFCDYFQPGSRAGGGGKSAADLKAAAEALFKDKK